jgi:predicted MFS family arabinose efflux permease
MKSRPHAAWVAVGILWFVAMLNYLDRMMITAMREPIKADIAMTDAQFGLLTAVFLWIYGALSPFGGYLADRFSRRWVILGSLGVWSVVTWLKGHVRNFDELLLARALMGVSEACYIPAALASAGPMAHPGGGQNHSDRTRPAPPVGRSGDMGRHRGNLDPQRAGRAVGRKRHRPFGG